MSRGPPGLLQDPEAQVGQLPGLGDADRIQVDPGALRHRDGGRSRSSASHGHQRRSRQKYGEVRPAFQSELPAAGTVAAWYAIDQPTGEPSNNSHRFDSPAPPVMASLTGAGRSACPWRDRTAPTHHVALCERRPRRRRSRSATPAHGRALDPPGGEQETCVPEFATIS